MLDKVFPSFKDNDKTWIIVMAAALVASAITTGLLFGNQALSLVAGVSNLVFFAFWTVVGGLIAKRIGKVNFRA